MGRPYSLEIYVGDAEKPTQVFDSDSPFGAISKGDYIFADTWDHVEASWRFGNRRPRMIVQAVEHRLWNGPAGERRHQIGVTVTPERE
jgi:hypothetical protein